MPELTPEAFKLLLSHLGDDEEKAADEYLTLRFKLETFFSLRDRGHWNADHSALADETLNRVAAKFEEGKNIENINAWSYGTAKFVWKEFIRHNKPSVDPDSLPEQVAPEEFVEDEEDKRMNCLRSCLIEVTKDDAERKLLISYYDSQTESKNKDRRKTLAERLGIKVNALKTRMSRLRAKMEKCITECVRRQKLDVT